MKKRMTLLTAVLLCGALLVPHAAAIAGENTTDVAGENMTQVSGENMTQVSGENMTQVAGENTTAVAGEMGSAEDELAKDPILNIPTVNGEYKLEDCVKLGEYKGLQLEMEIDEVTDEDVDLYVSYMIQPEEIKDDKAVLEEGDTANLDFTGYKDGEAFAGGSSTGYDLEIGSGSFIPGFEDGMIGMKKGEERDLNLTFPENYASEELAGQDVVFHVKLNAIKRMPELTDDWVKSYSNGEYVTVEDFLEATRAELEAQNRSYAEADLQSKAWEMVMEDSEFLQLPEIMLQEGRDEYNGYLESEAEMYGLSAKEYIEQMGLTMEEYEQLNETQVRYEVENLLVLDALAEAEGITEKDPGYKEELTRLEQAYGLTEAELKENYGADTLDRHLRSVVVMNKILSYADVTEKMVSRES